MKAIFFLIFSILSLQLIGCASNARRSSIDRKIKTSVLDRGTYRHGRYLQSGIASYYADDFHGKKTANGEIFNKNDFTAAHKTLPFGAKVRVTNLSNGKSVIVRINDRGPYAKGRIIDLSEKAGKEIDLDTTGTANVKLEVLK